MGRNVVGYMSQGAAKAKCFSAAVPQARPRRPRTRDRKCVCRIPYWVLTLARSRVRNGASRCCEHVPQTGVMLGTRRARRQRCLNPVDGSEAIRQHKDEYQLLVLRSFDTSEICCRICPNRHTALGRSFDRIRPPRKLLEVRMAPLKTVRAVSQGDAARIRTHRHVVRGAQGVAAGRRKAHRLQCEITNPHFGAPPPTSRRP